MLEELRRDISVSFGLGFEHGERGWKNLDEQSVVETRMKDLITYGEQNFVAPFLGKPLRGRVCYMKYRGRSL
jgi:hypothetical protein